jgi:hypothetical protein
MKKREGRDQKIKAIKHVSWKGNKRDEVRSLRRGCGDPMRMVASMQGEGIVFF